MSCARATAATVFVFSTLALAPSASADKRAENAARDAMKKAGLEVLSTNYSAAAARLQKALRVCGAKRCAPETRALLLRDLGTMQFESGDGTAASESWIEAVKLYPSVDLNADYDRPELRAAWEEAKRDASPSPSLTARPTGKTSSETSSETSETSSETSSDAGRVEPSTAHALPQVAPPTEAPASEEREASKPVEPNDEKTRDEPAFARVWVGFSGAVDFLNVPAGMDVCKLSASGQPANTGAFYCTNPDGSDFPSRASPAQNDQVTTRNQAGQVGGGVKVGNQRAMLAIDYALTRNVLAGVRLGYVVGTYTGNAAVQDGRAFGPRWHLELRGTYVFGHSPSDGEGFAPMAFVAGGISEFDVSSASAVTLSGVAGQHPVRVWLTDGPFFVALGGGMRYQFSPRVAMTAALRMNGAFGGNGFLPSIGPELGAQYGF
ncbi:MAG: hypothetical protein M3O50_10960 [Myxococcota bacterium]|nr:hypothetical protein [Myxococcota bacterium]